MLGKRGLSGENASLMFAPLKRPRSAFLAGMLMLWFLAPRGGVAALDETNCLLSSRSLPRVRALCSTLEVPENPAEPDGASIALSVARIPAQASVPLPDPLVLIAGGPGGSAIDMYLQLRNAFADVLAQRDIVLMDQRGTGRSAEGFECPVPADLDFQTARAELLDTIVASCLDMIERDARFFTTSIAVRDLDALREAIGVEQWNIYGVSYGSRVAQHYLRRYPEHTRAVVLDGAVPPGVVLGPEIAAAAQQALDAIFARCSEDTDCSGRFGDIESKFESIQAELAEGEVRVTRTNSETGENEEIRLYEGHLQGLTRLMSYSHATAALLPLVIDEAFKGEYSTLLAQAELVLGDVDQALSFPMHNTVICSEDFPRMREAATPQSEDTYLAATIVDALVTICERWPAGPVDGDFTEPVVSDRPVLLLSGSNDPATPARYAERIIAEGISNSLHVIAQDQGHGIIAIGCVPQLVNDFIDDAGFAELDPSCVDEARPLPFFLSPAGPAP